MLTTVFWFFVVISPGDWNPRIWGGFGNLEQCKFYQQRSEHYHFTEDTGKYVSKCIRFEHSYTTTE